MTAPAEPPPVAPPRPPWAALAALTMPVLLISMDNTILGFAVPRLSEALHPSSSALLWIIDVYSFVLSGLLVTMGNLGDRIGRRRLLVAGMVGFSLASVAAAWAPSAGALIAARAALGVAGATLMPSTLSLIRNIYADARQRQTAIAVWAAMFAVGSALGPLVGGLLLERFWWGSVFLAGLPVTLVLLVLAPRVVPESRDPAPGPFDLPGAALSMAAMLPVVYGVKRVAEDGPSAVAAATVAVGVAAGVAFVRRQGHTSHPMIDVTLFRVRAFRAAIAGNLIGCFGFAGSMYFLTQHLQLVAGMSPVRAGLQLLPGIAASITASMVVGRLTRRRGPFPVVAAALVLGAAGFALLTRLPDDGSVAVATLAVAMLNAGFAGAITVSVDAIVASVPPERAGAGASLSETANELGIALGTAVLGSVVTAVYRRDLTAVDGVSAGALEEARETLGAAFGVARDLGGPAGEALRQAAGTAFTTGIHSASAAAAVAVAAVAALAWRARRGPGLGVHRSDVHLH